MGWDGWIIVVVLHHVVVVGWLCQIVGLWVGRLWIWGIYLGQIYLSQVLLLWFDNLGRVLWVLAWLDVGLGDLGDLPYFRIFFLQLMPSSVWFVRLVVEDL